MRPSIRRHEISIAVFQKTCLSIVNPPRAEGRTRRHETWRWAAMDVMAVPTSAAVTDGEVVWSWPLDAEVKLAADAVTARAGDGGKKADPQGEHEGHR